MTTKQQFKRQCITTQRTIADLVNMAYNDLVMWQGHHDPHHKIAHAYSCLGNALKLIKTETEETRVV